MILHNDQYYHNMLNNYMESDLKACKYNYYQHNINFYHYVKNLISSIKSEYDLTNNNYIPVINYLNKRLNNTITQIEYYNQNVIARN